MDKNVMQSPILFSFSESRQNVGEVHWQLSGTNFLVDAFLQPRSMHVLPGIAPGPTRSVKLGFTHKQLSGALG